MSSIPSNRVIDQLINNNNINEAERGNFLKGKVLRLSGKDIQIEESPLDRKKIRKDSTYDIKTISKTIFDEVNIEHQQRSTGGTLSKDPFSDLTKTFREYKILKDLNQKVDSYNNKSIIYKFFSFLGIGIGAKKIPDSIFKGLLNEMKKDIENIIDKISSSILDVQFPDLQSIDIDKTFKELKIIREFVRQNSWNTEHQEELRDIKVRIDHFLGDNEVTSKQLPLSKTIQEGLKPEIVKERGFDHLERLEKLADQIEDFNIKRQTLYDIAKAYHENKNVDEADRCFTKLLTDSQINRFGDSHDFYIERLEDEKEIPSFKDIIIKNLPPILTGRTLAFDILRKYYFYCVHNKKIDELASFFRNKMSMKEEYITYVKCFIIHFINECFKDEQIQKALEFMKVLNYPDPTDYVNYLVSNKFYEQAIEFVKVAKDIDGNLIFNDPNEREELIRGISLDGSTDRDGRTSV